MSVLVEKSLKLAKVSETSEEIYFDEINLYSILRIIANFSNFAFRIKLLDGIHFVFYQHWYQEYRENNFVSVSLLKSYKHFPNGMIWQIADFKFIKALNEIWIIIANSLPKVLQYVIWTQD